MSRKAIWAVVACLMGSALVLAPSGQAASMKTTPPEYGGTITISFRYGLIQWDPYRYESVSNYITSFVFEKPLMGFPVRKIVLN